MTDTEPIDYIVLKITDLSNSLDFSLIISGDDTERSGRSLKLGIRPEEYKKLLQYVMTQEEERKRVLT